MGNVGIYKILNPEGKIYIGYSTDLQRREEQYSQNNISTQILLKESINKYSWKQHKFKIIEYCDDNKLKLQEKYWIKFYKSYQNGLNMNIGGGGPIKHSKETIQKMKKPKPKGFGAVISKLKLGKPNPKLSLSKTGKPSTFMGKKHKSESIDKMSKVRKGKTYEEIFGEESIIQLYNRSLPRKGKDIECINTGVVYSSLKEASKILGINANSISNILLGIAHQTRNKLKFKYVS